VLAESGVTEALQGRALMEAVVAQLLTEPFAWHEVELKVVAGRSMRRVLHQI
jgi:hypothetical protein